MMWAGETTQLLSFVGPVANGSELLAPLSPFNMYAMPVAPTDGVVFFIQESAHPCHSLSRHIGSSMDAPPNSEGEFGKHTQPFVPARSSRGWPSGVAGQSMMVACFAIAAGAALMASAIFSESLIFFVAVPV